MNREKKLVKKTVVYAIGNLGSKILSYMMVMIYSYYILPEDMGYYDLILTTVSMLQPIIIFQLNDGVYRYLMDNKYDNGKIVSTGFKFLCCTTLIAEICWFIVAIFTNSKYAFWIGLYLATTMFFTFFHDSIRGFSKSKTYAFIGILNSSVMLLVEVVCIIILKLGVKSLLISKVIANIVCLFALINKQSEFKSIFKVKADINILKKLLQYSTPLVPNTICWWIVNFSDRYIILFFLTLAANGIYSFSNKFPTILATITSIFFLAWQESAIKEYDAPNRDDFFSNVFKKYYIFLFSLCLCAIPATKFIINLFLASEYKVAWKYTGFLYLGVVFNALASFLGIGYQISRETRKSLETTIVAALINIIINVSLINFIGLYAASLSTFIAYFALFFMRIKHTKKYFNISIDWNTFYQLLLMNVLDIVLVSIFDNFMCLILTFVLAIYSIFLNRKLILSVLRTLKINLIKTSNNI